MLSDRDRIFLNLYGQGDWGLKGARARGAWDGKGGGGAALPAPTVYFAVAITLPALSPIRTVY